MSEFTIEEVVEIFDDVDGIIADVSSRKEGTVHIDIRDPTSYGEFRRKLDKVQYNIVGELIKTKSHNHRCGWIAP